jgi:hypothetical protein
MFGESFAGRERRGEVELGLGGVRGGERISNSLWLGTFDL